jgi:hypothetical protein
MSHLPLAKLASGLVLALAGVSAFGQLDDYTMSSLQGYTVIGSKTIAGWYDGDGARGEGFEGCQFGRVIVFTDNRILTCSMYTYQYAYRPTAVILSNGASFKMVVNNTVYEMRR